MIDMNTNVVVVDDICDGGRTFIELLKASPTLDCGKSLSLFVTHGIFSQGTKPLFDAGFQFIGRTDSLAAVGCLGPLEQLAKLITIGA